MQSTRLITILFLCFTLSADATYRRVTLTFTNVPSIGQSNIIDGTVIRWSNSAPSSAWVRTNGINGSATNLARLLAGNYSKYRIEQTNSTNIVIGGNDVSFTITGDFGFLTTNSYTATNDWFVTLPFDLHAETNRTNTADALIYGLSKYGRTNSFSETSQALTNHFNRGQVQTGGNKTFTNSAFNGGTNTGTKIIGSPSITALAATVTNFTVFSIVNTVTNVSLDGARITNGTGTFVDVQGSNFNISSLQATNPVLWGNVAIGDTNTGVSEAWMLRTYTNVAGESRFALYNDQALHNVFYVTEVGGVLTTVFGEVAGEPFQTVGPMSSGVSVSAPTGSVTYANVGVIKSTNGGQFSGTNNWQGDVSYAPLSRTLVNGDNSDVPVDGNVIVRLSGPSAAYTVSSLVSTREGDFKIITVDNPGHSFTLLHNSGIGTPADANKLWLVNTQNVVLTNRYVVFYAINQLTNWLIIPIGN